MSSKEAQGKQEILCKPCIRKSGQELKGNNDVTKLAICDEGSILKWNTKTGETAAITKLPDGVYPADMAWFPSNVGGRQSASELFVLGTTDGKFHLVSKNGRFEKSVEAHNGAVIAIKWSKNGNSLVTAGEDGQVKIWSRSGMLRSTLAQVGTPVYSVAWGPDSEQILYACGKQIIIKPLSPSAKPTQWKGHDGLIMKLDWSSVNNLIVSGAEDRKYKVWDSYGRLLFASHPHHYPIMSVSWSPNGQMFAVGAFNTLRLCDKSGWCYSLDKPNTGSIYSLDWSRDSTLVAGGCGNGHVIFAGVVNQTIEWKHLVVTLQEEKVLLVEDVVNNTKDQLEFRDRVVKMSLGWDHLVVTTSSQCLIYSTSNWNTPLIFDLKGLTTSAILLARKLFLIVDSVQGLSVYSYEGRLICSPKYSGIRTDSLNVNNIAVSSDTLVLVDSRDKRAYHVFDINTGRELTDKPLYHSQELLTVALDQYGNTNERCLAFTDKNNDLFLVQIRHSNPLTKLKKLGGMVTTLMWHDTTNMLSALQDGRFTVWYYPRAVYIDMELLPQSKVFKDAGEFGKNPQIVSFLGHHCTLRRSDGSLVSTAVSPYPTILQNYVSKTSWDDAVRLCRFVKDGALWASLAAMATAAKELNTAEIAYAAINETEKVEYISYIKDISNKAARNAEMSLFCKQTGEAEGTLLQAGLVYRAIRLNVDLFRWNRALELAVKHKTHVDTVLAYRQKYLQDFGLEESDNVFIQYSKEIAVDWTTIQNKINMELENERGK